jgi:hypothetical protein
MIAAVASSAMKRRAVLQLENVALRHQIGVLQRSAKKRLPLNNADRLFWIGLSRVWAEWRSALRIVKPDTVIAWHRKAFRKFWTWKVRRGRPGRPAVSADIRALIRRMSRENPDWGAPRRADRGESATIKLPFIEITQGGCSYLDLCLSLRDCHLANFGGFATPERRIFCVRDGGRLPAQP